MRPLASDDEQVRFWVRHTRFGVAIMVALPLIATTESWLSDPRAVAVQRTWLGVAVVLATLPLLMTPVETIVRHRYGRLFFDGWEAIGIAALSYFVWVDGGATSPYVSGYFVILAHAALAYPPVGTMIAGAFTAAAYVTVALIGDPVSHVFIGDFAATMLAAAAVCAYASWNHVLAYRRIADYTEQVEVLATHDGLTDCLNRRAFHKRLDAACATATTDAPVSLVLLDVDHFKGVNDAHGHLAGDDVLATVGRTLLESCRRTDAAGRLGGDEFAMLLPGTSLCDAKAVAERICAQVREATRYGATVSVGVAAVAGRQKPERLLENADRAVYEAKRAGRDQVAAVAVTAA